MQDREQVGAVVERHVRRAVDDGDHARGVGVGVLAAAPVRDAAVRRQRRHDLVLRGQRVRGGERHLGPAGDQRPREARGLRGHVQAGADPQAVERALGGEALADRAEDGHLPVRPLDAGPALVGERLRLVA